MTDRPSIGFDVRALGQGLAGFGQGVVRKPEPSTFIGGFSVKEGSTPKRIVARVRKPLQSRPCENRRNSNFRLEAATSRLTPTA